MTFRCAVLLACLASCDSEAGFPDARVYDGQPPGGTFSLAWTITDTGDSLPLTCDGANATTVSIAVRELSEGSGHTEIFSCSSMSGTSSSLPAGTYTLTYSLRGFDGEVVSIPGPNALVIGENQDVQLGTIDFQVDAVGGFSLLISAGSGDSCTGGGAGIDQTGISLTYNNSCVPLILDIAAGGSSPASTHNATCPQTPQACIERDQDVSIAGIASGTYRLEAIGYISGSPCWRGSRTIRVPTAGESNAYSLVLGFNAAEPGCP